MEYYEFDDDKNYYQYDDLVAKYPIFKKNYRGMEKFFEKYGFESEHYFFARYHESGEWVESHVRSLCTDKAFLLKEFVDKHMISAVDKNSNNDPLPPVLELDDDEGFFDEDGERLDIQVVGERDVDSCFFRLEDIANAFGIANLKKMVLGTKYDRFQEGEHYRRFHMSNGNNISETTKGVIYLTYIGTLEVIFKSRSSIAKRFVKWATKTLFTVQLGTKSQKQKLASKLVGFDLDQVKKLGKITSGCISCVYLFSLGKVKDLRDTMDIPDEYPDNSTVYKYGRTGDIAVRTRQHQKTYGKYQNVDLQLVYHGYVDPDHASKAETAIAHSMQGMDLTWSFDSHKELIIVPDKKYKYVQEQYDNITELYRGRMKQVVDELERQKYLIELAKQETEMVKKDMEILKLQLELAKRDARKSR